MMTPRGTDDETSCPHCGATVPKKALVCRECGADAETAWAEGADKWAADIPTGYGEEEDFDYDDFIRREFPGQGRPQAAVELRKWALRLVAALVCLGLLRWVVGG